MNSSNLIFLFSAKNEGANPLKRKAEQELALEESKKKQQKMQPSVSEDHLKKATDKSTLMLKAEEQVKKYLKPLFIRQLVTRDNYKIIMRKCVEKIYAKSFRLNHNKVYCVMIFQT